MKMDFGGKQDVYLEVAARYRNYIELGVYREGDALPSVRFAAAELGVNPNTVAKAFALLECEGMITVVPKKGAFVAFSGGHGETGGQPETGKNSFSVSIPKESLRLIYELRRTGVDKEQLIKWITEVYDNA